MTNKNESKMEILAWYKQSLPNLSNPDTQRESSCIMKSRHLVPNHPF